MSLVNPIALSKVAFDATNNETFYFTSNGGDQVVKNRLTIRDNSTNVIVYQNTLTSYLFQQTVPSGTLTNGTYYNYYFNTYDIDDNMSADSNVVVFYCYSIPTITITNMPSGNIISGSSYTFNATYTQTESEKLDYLIYYLYDSNGIEISNSGQLRNTNTPPLSFTYTFNGFKDETTYKIQVKAISVNGTKTQSSLVTFSTSYYYPMLFSLLQVENKCSEGYIDIKSNAIVAEGSTNVNPSLFFSCIADQENADSYIKWGEWYTTDSTGKVSTWAERYMLDLRANGTTATFDNGFTVPTDFQYQRWEYPIRDGVLGTMTNNLLGAPVLTLTLKSGIPSGESTLKNWVEISSSDSLMFAYSNYVDAMKDDTNYTIWFKKTGQTYTLTLTVISAGTGTVVSSGSDTYPTTAISGNIDEMFPLTILTYQNCSLDNVDVTKNSTRVFSTTFPIWDYYTCINCDCSSLIAGNISLVLSQVEGVKLKRRLVGTFDWITLKYIPISYQSSMTFEIYDNLVPSGKTFDYAIVPILSGDIEGEYISVSVDSEFNGSYLCGNDKIFKLYSNVSYPTIGHNKQVGVFQPLGKTYQITVSNAIANGNSGSFSASVYGYNFEDNRTIDRLDATKQAFDIREYVTNIGAFMLKDWDGRIRIVSYTGGFTESPNLATGAVNISFNWTETGSYNSQEDLYENGLIAISS